MERRLELHNKFIDILGTKEEDESRVYFDPPASKEMEYPCIKYSLSGMDQKYANNALYAGMNRYEIITIDYDPDSVIHSEIIKLPMCKFDRAYTADGLHHKVYTLYH
jgi:hypothetical protein